MARNADRIRKLIRAENGGRELRVPYARGTGRAKPRATVIRHEILAEILADDPTVTEPSQTMLYDDFSYLSGASAIGMEEASG